MTDQHPTITPPPELVKQWIKECDQPDDPRWEEYEQDIASRAAQYGADQRGEVNEAKLQQARDQELEACNNWLVLNGYGEAASRLRAARRPKHKTRAEIALEQYDRCVSILKEKGYSPAHCIRDALVYLKQLEESND